MDKFNSLPDCTFGEAVSRFFKKYAQFKGAASRSEFWWAFLFYFGIYFILFLLSMSCHVLSILLWLWELAIIVPDLAIISRRLHDGGFSGKFAWLLIIPLLGEVAVLVMCALPTREDRWREEWMA